MDAAYMLSRSLTARIERLRRRLAEGKLLSSLRNVKPELPENFWEVEPVVRRGMMFRATLEVLATPIGPDELIIGDVPYDEFRANCEVLPVQLLDGERKGLEAEAVARFLQEKDISEIRDFGRLGTLFSIGRNFGHIIADYRLPLRIGFGGIRRNIEQHLSELSGSATPQRDFLEAARLSTLGAERYIRRHGEHARRCANEEPEASRRAELNHLAETCFHIATDPPRSFHEALQLVWFTQLLLEVESGVSAFSFGRLDQYLYPYLKADLENGALAGEQAQELVDCFWIKANEQNDRCPDAGRAITIGGIGQDGEDRVNELTFMMLSAASALRMQQPKLNARIHSGSPADYIRRCCEVACRNTGPQFYNDEQIIASLVHFGFSRTEAVEYGLIGCYETGIPGQERPWPMAGCLNLGKCLELALNDGVCRISGEQIGPRTGRLPDFDAYEQIEQAYERQVVHAAGLMTEKNALDEYLDEALRPQPFLSTLMQDCIGSGKDISAGGARYTHVGIRCTGLSAVADSLAALKTLVYDEGAVIPQEIETALSTDFEACEPLCHMLVNRPPKFGNDRDAVDQVARWVGEGFCREVLKHRTVRGGRFKPGLFSFTSFLRAGTDCAALPNGRRTHQSFANGVTPMHGMDRNGPTAMLRSAAKLNYLLSPNANTLDLKLSPSTGTDSTRVAELVTTYFEMGGMQLQPTMLSSDELKAAQREPEKHAHLLVRVAGYSAHFVSLEKDVQDEIIRRTEHMP